MEFLKELSEAPLPVSIYQTELIDQVRSYVSARLVTADLPNELKTHSRTQTPAQVLKITADGKRVLKKIPQTSWVVLISKGNDFKAEPNA